MSATSPPTVDMVALRNVSKSYGSFRALTNVSMQIARGERIVICGPSGSGKSTLIRCINGIERHDQGSVFVEGVELTSGFKDTMKVRRQVGMIFQTFNLFPHLTILENCMLAPMRSLGVPPQRARETAMGYLQKVRVADQSHKYPPMLSGGQQQRAAIARALCMMPKVLLLDEPTSALDPEMVNEVLDTLMLLAKEGMTMICVTHEMGFARKVADRIVFMDAGQIVEVAEPEEFFSAPKTGRARVFINQVAH